MHILGLIRTARLWYRLDHESAEYYRTLHDAQNQARHIGPDVFPDLPTVFSDLQHEHRRLKRRFIVMAIIGRKWTSPVWGSISDLVLNRADQVIGRGVIQGILERESDNVRLR